MNRTGYFIRPPARRAFASHYQYTGLNRLLSPPECDWIVAYAERCGMQAAAIGNPDQSRVDASYRCCAVTLLAQSQETWWLYERLTDRIQAVNDADYHFALSGLLEPLQILRYDAPDKPDAHAGHYDWHQDFGADYMACRKLSMTVQLSDPADYDGGRLVLLDPGPKEMNYVERGAGIVFPSWSPHCVTPLTRGRRYALVIWVHGEPFR